VRILCACNYIGNAYRFLFRCTMSDKVLSRTTAENPYPESEQAGYLKELWELSRNRIRHALSQKRTAVMSAMKKLYLGVHDREM
jgi:hypothetical protein